MKNLIATLLLLFAVSIAASAQSADTREGRHAINTQQNAADVQFAGKMERLKAAILASNASQQIYLQSELLLMVRKGLEKASPVDQELLMEVLNQFEHFSFHTADAQDRETHIRALGDALEVIKRNQ